MRKSIFVDLNVIMDALFWRNDFAAALKVLHLSEDGRYSLHVSAHAVTTFSYLLGREKVPRHEQTRQLRWLLRRFELEPIDGTILLQALSSPVNDYEDAVVEAAAVKCGAMAIVTSNVKDFVHSSVPAYLPAAYLRRYRD